MQSQRIVAIIIVLAFAQLGESSTVSEATARAWLQRHPAPQGDELAELKDANPEAYAIVKALLTKRSLGLLDPKHPSASFAAPPPSATQESAPSGAAAFAKFTDPSASTASNTAHLTYPDVPVAPQRMDMFSWRPHSSAMDDESMVANVLGAVAELKGQAPTRSLLSNSKGNVATTSSLEADESAFAASIADAAPQAAPALVAPAAPGLPDFKENSYLRGADFDSAPQIATVSAHGSEQSATGSSALASFSWDDDNDKKAQPAPAAGLVQHKGTVKETSAGGNMLMSWLGGGSKTTHADKPAPTKPVQASEEQPSNPYTVGLW